MSPKWRTVSNAPAPARCATERSSQGRGRSRNTTSHTRAAKNADMRRKQRCTSRQRTSSRSNHRARRRHPRHRRPLDRCAARRSLAPDPAAGVPAGKGADTRCRRSRVARRLDFERAPLRTAADPQTGGTRRTTHRLGTQRQLELDAHGPALRSESAPITEPHHLFGSTVDASSGSEPWATAFALTLEVALVVQNGLVVLSVEDARACLRVAPGLPDKALLLKLLDDAPATSVGIGLPQWIGPPYVGIPQRRRPRCSRHRSRRPADSR